MNKEILSFLPYLSSKYNLGLDVRGGMVYRNGQLQTPFQVQDIFDQVFQPAREQFLNDLFLEHINQDAMNKTPQKTKTRAKSKPQ